MRAVKLTILWLARHTGLFAVARRLTGRKLRILCYHGFALDDEARFRPQLFIEQQTFEKRMATLSASGAPVLPLDEAVRRLYDGSLPRGAVAITIDDGFHGVHARALPVLARLGLPSSVYVTTYYVEHPHPIFRLVVQYMFWRTTAARLETEGLPWATGEAVDLRDAEAARRAQWACIEFGEQRCAEDERVALCRELGRRLGMPYDDIVASRILHLMTPDELRAVQAAGMTVELHTHRHRFPADDRSAALREIEDNRQRLAGIVGRRPRHFCYPSGLWQREQWAWLDDLQVASSTTCIEGLNGAETPRHGLYRLLDGENIHPLEFEAYLSGFLELLRRLRPAPATAGR
jgi:peptidoglycan/xylan/chitin deacetylase (PgdA/CDA1 family)